MSLLRATLTLLAGGALAQLIPLLLGPLITRLFTPEGIAALKSFVVNITLPAVMFAAFAKAEYSPASLIVPVVIFAACVLALAASRSAYRPGQCLGVTIEPVDRIAEIDRMSFQELDRRIGMGNLD